MWGQPVFDLFQADALAPGIVLQLIQLQFAEREVAGLGMSEVQAADAGRWGQQSGPFSDGRLGP